MNNPVYTRPGVIMLLAWLAGSIAALFAPLPLAIVLLAGSLPFLVLGCRSRNVRLTLFGITLLFASVGLYQHGEILRREAMDRSQLQAFVVGGERFTQLTGTLATIPRRTASGWSFLVEEPSLAVRGHVASSGSPIAVRMREGIAPAWLATALPGDLLSLQGTVTELASGRLAHGYDGMLRALGATHRFEARTIAIKPTHTEAATLARFPRLTALRLEAIVLDMLPEQEAALLLAMTLGRTHHLSTEQRTAYRRTGLLHLFSVSGLHTTLVGLLLLGMLGSAGVGPLPRILLLIVALFFFAALVGLKSAVIRAALMLVLFESRELLRRPIEPLAALATVGLLMMIVWPLSAWQLDFQMSFLCMLAIVLATPARVALSIQLGRKLGWGWRSAIPIQALQILLISVLIQLLLTPLFLGHFGEVSLIAPLANVLVLPLAGLCVQLTFAFYLLAYPFPELSAFALSLLTPILWLIDNTAALMGALPHAVWAHPPLLAALALLIVIAVIGMPWARFREAGAPAPSRWRFAPALLVGILLLSLLRLEPKANDFTVLFLDVGQGDAILLRCPEGSTLLVDAGPMSSANRLVQQLHAEGIRHLDGVLITHADSDHFGGLSAVIGALSVGRVYTGESYGPQREFAKLDETIRQGEIPLHRLHLGDRLVMSAGGPQITVLHPDATFERGSSERNDASIVLLVEYRGRRFLLTGDAERAAEAAFLPFVPEGIDVLKAGHHGADTSTGIPLLLKTQPVYTVISCGFQNRYGHPAAGLMERLALTDTIVCRTDLQGSIRFTVGRDGSMDMSTQRRIELSAGSALGR